MLVALPAAKQTKTTNRRAGPKARAAAAAAQQQRQDDPADPFAGTIEDPTLLPRCRPGNGVICSDRDYTELLKADPANIDLADTLQLGGVRPSAEGSLGLSLRVDPLTDSVGGSIKPTSKVEVNSNFGFEQLNAKTSSTTTAAGADLKGRLELALPEKLTVTLGKAGSESSIERTSIKPNFYYVLGQNFNLPVGLSVAADGVAGKRK